MTTVGTVFFFKQKTAYEIGLGIPAEPLFRSPGRAPERFLPLKITCRRSDVMSKGKKRSGARPGRPQPLRGTKGKRKGARLWYVGGQIGRASCRERVEMWGGEGAGREKRGQKDSE